MDTVRAFWDKTPVPAAELEIERVSSTAAATTAVRFALRLSSNRCLTVREHNNNLQGYESIAARIEWNTNQRTATCTWLANEAR